MKVPGGWRQGDVAKGDVAKQGQDWVAREIAAEMSKAHLEITGAHANGTPKVVEMPASSRKGPAPSPHEHEDAQEAGEEGSDVGRAAAEAAAADPAANRVRARTDGVEEEAWSAVVHPKLGNFIIGDTSIEQESRENAATDTDLRLPALPTLGPKSAVEEGPPPPASAAPSAGDMAAKDATEEEKRAQAAVGANLFNSDMFKALKPFAEPPIDPH